MIPTTRHPMHVQRRQAAWLLLALGFAHVPLVGFHFAIPSLFRWGAELPRLSPDNVMLFWGALLCSTFWLASMGAATLFDGLRRLRDQDGILPRGFWLWMAGFYLFRIAMQIPFLREDPTGLGIILLLAPAPVLYTLVWHRLGPATIPSPATVGTHLRPESWLR